MARARTTFEIVIETETLTGERRTKVWRPGPYGGQFVVVDSAGRPVARLTARRHKRVGGAMPMIDSRRTNQLP